MVHMQKQVFRKKEDRKAPQEFREGDGGCGWAVARDGLAKGPRRRVEGEG